MKKYLIVTVIFLVAAGCNTSNVDELSKSKTQEMNNRSEALNNDNQIDSETLGNSEVVITPSNTTANWQTYKSEKFGYSIKYPTDWDYKETDNNETCFYQKGVEYFYKGDKTNCAIRIYTAENTKDQNLKSYVDDKIFINPQETSVSYFVVDGVKGVIIQPFEETYLINNNFSYFIDTAGYADEVGIPQFSPLITDMVSTLKF